MTESHDIIGLVKELQAMNSMQARIWEHYCFRSDKVLGCPGEGNKIGIREKNSMMLFHDGDCYPKGEVSPQQLRFEYVAGLHNAFPAIAEALLIAVEALEKFAEDETNPMLADQPDHVARWKARLAMDALYRIQSLKQS